MRGLMRGRADRRDPFYVRATRLMLLRFADPQEVREQGHPRRARLLRVELDPVEGRPFDGAGEALPVLGRSEDVPFAAWPGREGMDEVERGLLAEPVGE